MHEELKKALQHRLFMMAAAARESQQGATHEENRSEGDKDMRATEQSYLARGQAIRAEDLAEELQRFESMPVIAHKVDAAITLGSLIEARIDDAPRVFFLIAQAGGTDLDVDGVRVTVVTPSSPVGAALQGRRAGEDFELVMKGASREWEIVAVG